jgi:hypothetical protein
MARSSIHCLHASLPCVALPPFSSDLRTASRVFVLNDTLAPVVAQLAMSKFFRLMESHKGNLRDIDSFHWSSQSWRDYWLDAISICLARGRGQIGTEVARTDVFHRQATHSVSGSEGEAS